MQQQDDCYELELWYALSRNLPGCGAYEANLVSASLKSKEPYEAASNDLVGRYPVAPRSLLQLQINENEEKS